MRPILSRLRTDKSGNFGIMTALMLVPLVGVAGLAVDFSNALSVRTDLYSAADAAAVGAVADKSPGAVAAMAMTSDGTVTLAENDARKLFLGQQAPITLANVPISVDASLSKTGNKLASTVTFQASVPTTFLKILGRNSIPIAGTATAQSQTATFMDFYMLLDNTPSMGVGATSADVKLLQSNTSDTCAFACHIVTDDGTANGKEDPNSYYNLAKKLGATTRIDVVREATKNLTQTAKDTRITTDQFRMAIYTFGKRAQDAGLTQISDLSSNMDTVAAKAAAIDLMSIPKQNFNNDTQTSFDSALTQMNDKITPAGGGTSGGDRQKILFFVTDGVGDSTKPSGCTQKLTGTRCQEPIDTSFCKPLKDRNVKIAVLYTTYLPLPDNDWYKTWIKPFQSSIPTKLQACASDGLYFEVNMNQGITDAMKALFQKIVSNPRITS